MLTIVSAIIIGCSTGTAEFEQSSSKAIARIGADSKYWMSINGQPVIFEGSLKRGPEPGAGYYDEVDVAQYLKAWS